MTLELKVAWIDDAPDRAERFRGALVGNLRDRHAEVVDFEVVPLTENLITDLSARAEVWAQSPPDLIMIDQNFTMVRKVVFNLSGSSLAHLLRVQLTGVPMVCITSQPLSPEYFSAEDISEYTYLFDLNSLNAEANIEMLFAIAHDFKAFQFSAQEPVRHAIIKILNAPDSDRVALMNVLPEEFEGSARHSTTPHRMAHWVLNVLMRRPGFLCDELDAATMLGLTQQAFGAKVKDQFGPALYTGPFATSTRPLWWASALVDTLYALAPEHDALIPAEAGRKLAGIDEGDFSKCAITGDAFPPPDVVAFTDETASERRAARNVYTEPLSEQASSQLGFPTLLKLRKVRVGG